MLLETDGISLQKPQLVRAAFEASRADFSGRLTLAVAESAGMAPLATFDERLARLPGTRMLGRKRKQRWTLHRKATGEKKLAFRDRRSRRGQAIRFPRRIGYS